MSRTPFPQRRRRRRLALAALLVAGLGAASTAPASAHPETGARHRVAPGETLSELAELLGTSVQALAGANDLDDPNLVVAGAVLAVPAAPSEGPS